MERSESTAANTVRRSRRRWLQFSLRTAFVVLTIGCLLLGWWADRARKRGQAIDAILDRGGSVSYQEGSPYVRVMNPKPVYIYGHFWLDLKATPVDIRLSWVPLSAAVGTMLSQIHGIDTLEISSGLTDDNLQHLETVECHTIKLDGPGHVTDAAVDALRHKLPNTSITCDVRYIYVDDL